ncbi:MAG: radical SAM protein [Deferrisomatales bacterium]|nr:radical SAM protein [Deferrisomatales bacterium]
MKILFVAKTVDFIDPLGVMLMSALARRDGHETALAVLDREDVLQRVERERPSVVAYSASTGEHKYYVAFNARLKRRFPDTVTLLGGPHATFFPEVLQNSTLDALCVGEGDAAFPEFLAAVGGGAQLTGIRNIATRSHPAPEIRPLVQDLDALPYPDRDLYYRDTEMGPFPLKSFMTSRGCPYPCTYCFNHAFNRMYRGLGPVLRRHSVDYVIDQIREVRARYPLQCVKFYDDIFIPRIDAWMEEFASRYPREIGLPFHCLTRANLVSEDVVRLLKEAGCCSVSMSIEAGNDQIRETVLRRKMAREQIVGAFHLFERYGIPTFANNILGLPGSTVEDEIESLDLNLACRVTFAEFPIYYPYPKTELGDRCRSEGFYTESYDEMPMSYHGGSRLNCFSQEEKDVQRNLSELGLVAVLFPRLRNVIVDHLIRCRPNKLFFFAYFLCKAYVVWRKVYPFRIDLPLALRLFRKSLRLERFKHWPGDSRDVA